VVATWVIEYSISEVKVCKGRDPLSKSKEFALSTL